MNFLLRLCLGSAFLLCSTALPAQDAPSSSEKESFGPTPEQGVVLWRSVDVYSSAMMSNTYISLVYADKGLQEGRNLEDLRMLVSQEQATLRRLEQQSSLLRTAFAGEKDLCYVMDTILGGVALLKAQAKALSDVINGSSRTEAGVDARRQASRTYLLKMMGSKEDSKVVP